MESKRKQQSAHLVPAIPLVLAATLMLGLGPAHALQPVNPADGCGQTLPKADDDGSREYVLTGDLACSGAVSGVVITASNVVFHLAGHTLSNPTCDENVTFGGIFVAGGTAGVRIEGGTVSGFNDGIVLSSSHSRVEGMTVTGACGSGVLGQGQNNSIERNVVTASGNGVALTPSRDTRVASNHLSGNAIGIVVSDAGADNNVVENNIIDTSTEVGVLIANGTGNRVQNNAVNNNANGISIASPDSLAGGNTVSASSNTGIAVSAVGAPSTVSRNTVLGSGVTDMSDSSAGCAANVWTSNTFQTDLAGGASDGGPGVGCI